MTERNLNLFFSFLKKVSGLDVIYYGIYLFNILYLF